MARVSKKQLKQRVEELQSLCSEAYFAILLENDGEDFLLDRLDNAACGLPLDYDNDYVDVDFSALEDEDEDTDTQD
jgi:hypothetical protein